MADRYCASPLSVQLSQEDHGWLAKLAQDEDVSIRALVKGAVQHLRYWQEEGEEALKEALGIFEAERSSREDERRRRLYFQREYQLQSRRLHDVLRDERHRRWEQETRLRDERKLRIECENQLRDERNRRAECEKQLRGERDAYGQQASAAAAYRDAPYDPTITKLLALAIYSESDSEATAAFAKARSLHHQKR
jgi:hypothetical protein